MPYKTGTWGIVAQNRSQKRLLYFRQYRQLALEKLGNKCVRCGFDDPRTLQIDHIKGGGCQERKGLSSKQRYQLVLDDHDDKYQILCANCNWIKRYENKEVKKVR